MGLTVREKFEAAVIERFKESGYLEVQVRVECLGRVGDGYADGSVDAYWDFYQAGAASVEVDLDAIETESYDCSGNLDFTRTCAAIVAAGGTVKP